MDVTKKNNKEGEESICDQSELDNNRVTEGGKYELLSKLCFYIIDCGNNTLKYL